MSPAGPDPKYRFQTFVVGAANRLAVSAARAVAQAPGAAYNPLFIYSHSGLGKTHLLLATAHMATELAPGLRVRYAALGDLVDALHGAVAAGQVAAFREQFHDVDMLLLDDVQFLAGQRETQAELLKLFDVLRRGGRQIVLASDRPPAEISDLDEQLLTRFSGGLIVDIDKPDYETRVAILRRKCEERAMRFPAGVVEAVARMGHGNVRELEGALTRLGAYEQLGEGQVVPAKVSQILGGRNTPVMNAAVMPDEFNAFLRDLAAVVTEQLHESRQRLADAIAAWSAAGYRTALLEQAGRTDAEGAIAAFEETVERLRALEAEAVAADPALAGAEEFRDPERLDEAEAIAAAAVAAATPLPAPVGVFTRDRYEIGPCNQFAVHASEAVMREPGRRYNPLVLHGPAGVGKSHLLHAIGNALAQGPDARVACARAQQFVDELIAALESASVERWRARWRRVTALLLDDAQVIAGTERAQEELFHLFNALHEAGTQIVLAFDRPPQQLDALEERLRSRFSGGLVVEIRPPDATLRQRIYRHTLQRLGQPVPSDVLSYLARREAEDVREIVATADELARAAQQSGAKLTLGFARRLLDDVPMTPPLGIVPPPAAAAPRDAPTPSGGPAPSPRATPARSATARLPGTPPAGASVRRGSPPSPIAPMVEDVDTFFLDREKTIWEWPDLSGRAIEELR
ncbi:MAG TPA: DnaA/Hda family protein [Gemmatimonadaceae bacterium]|nr:DnaA/Hda family protein [Gemmatimonadaceae bacterium]